MKLFLSQCHLWFGRSWLDHFVGGEGHALTNYLGLCSMFHCNMACNSATKVLYVNFGIDIEHVNLQKKFRKF